MKSSYIKRAFSSIVSGSDSFLRSSHANQNMMFSSLYSHLRKSRNTFLPTEQEKKVISKWTKWNNLVIPLHFINLSNDSDQLRISSNVGLWTNWSSEQQRLWTQHKLTVVHCLHWSNCPSKTFVIYSLWFFRNFLSTNCNENKQKDTNSKQQLFWKCLNPTRNSNNSNSSTNCSYNCGRWSVWFAVNDFGQFHCYHHVDHRWVLRRAHYALPPYHQSS